MIVEWYTNFRLVDMFAHDGASLCDPCQSREVVDARGGVSIFSLALIMSSWKGY